MNKNQESSSEPLAEDSNDGFEQLYHDYWKVHSEYIKQGHEPLAIAGILAAHALTIYRNSLSAEDYQMICSKIFDSADRVHLEPTPTLQ